MVTPGNYQLIWEQKGILSTRCYLSRSNSTLAINHKEF